MIRAPRPIRNAYGADLIELMLVVAVATVLIIRFILELSGYPKLGGGSLHIAHVLYGGLMMIGALIVIFAFLNSSVRWGAAFVGGVGFGFFIDEVGKFISNDVNYFFEPAVAVMYVVFMLLFFVVYTIRRTTLRPHDSLANALSMLGEERDGTLDARSKVEILSLLDRSDRDDPLVPLLHQRVLATPARQGRDLAPYARWRAGLAAWYHRVASRRRFSTIVIVIVTIYGLGALLTVITPLVNDGTGVDGQNEDFAFWIQAGSSGLTALLIAIGLVLRRSSRIRAYYCFKFAILVSLLITQIFVFYHDQFAALIGVILDLLLYAALTYMIGQEEAREQGAVERRVAAVSSLATEAT